MSAFADLLSSFETTDGFTWFDVSDSMTNLMDSVKDLLQVTGNLLVHEIDGQADSEKLSILASYNRTLIRMQSTLWLQWEQLPIDLRPQRQSDDLALSPIDRPFSHPTYCEAMMAAAGKLSYECSLFLQSSKRVIEEKSKERFVLWIFDDLPPSERSRIRLSRDQYFELLCAQLHNELREHAVKILARFPDAPRSRVVYDAKDKCLYQERSSPVGIIQLDAKETAPSDGPAQQSTSANGLAANRLDSPNLLVWNGRSVDVPRGAFRLLMFMWDRSSASALDAYRFVKDDHNAVPSADAIDGLKRRANDAPKNASTGKSLHTDAGTIHWDNGISPSEMTVGIPAGATVSSDGLG